MVGDRKLKDSLILAIILLIGFQAFPIIKVGGTFKIYELLALVLLLLELLYIKGFKFANNTSVVAFCFFVISPLISYLFSNLFLAYPSGFYNKYPGADSFKFNYYIFPFLQMLYMFFNFFVFNAIVISSYIYCNLKKILKYTVLIGTGIALYSIFAMFIGDLILKLPSFIQNKTEYDFRSEGFSQEPSFYILFQGWICLFAWYIRPLFKKHIWYGIMLINVASILLTFSTTIAAFLLIILISPFILNTSYKLKIKVLIIVGIGLLITYFALIYFNLYPLFEYVFVSKITNFFTAPEFTFDSGGIRRYSSELGVKIFKDYWLTGVGVGNSIYYMHIYDDLNMNIISAGSFPQSAFSDVLSEQGIIGGTTLLWFLFSIFRKLWTNRNRSGYNRMFFLGMLCNIVVMLSIAPIYALYLWVFIALGLNYIKYFEVSKHKNEIILV